MIAFLLTTSVSIAQNKEYKHSLNGIKKVKIETNASIKIIAENTSDLTLVNQKNDNTSTFFENEVTQKKMSKKDKREGLTAIYPGGKDNANGLGFSIKKEGTTLLITDLKSHFQSKKTTIKIPKNINIVVKGGELGDVYIKGFSSEIEAETTAGNIEVKDVTGPLTLYSAINDINVDFSTVNQTSPITISSSGSEIDVTLPANTKASLDMETNGTVYTNFDLQAPKKDGLKDISRKKIIGNINNGGVKIKLKSSLGNIYLRKK